MKRLTFRFGLTGILVLIGMFALAQPADMEAIEQLRQQWAELYNQGDIAGVANLYAEDARFFDANGEVAEGRAAIREAIQQNFDDLATQMEGATVVVMAEAIETQILGEVAFEVGSYSLTTADGQTVDTGSYIVISRMINGEWRIAHHISTSTALGQQAMQNAGAGEDDGEDAEGESE